MIAAFVLRAVGWVTLADPIGRDPPLVGPGLIVVGVAAAFRLPSGPDALAWLAVAAGLARRVGRRDRGDHLRTSIQFEWRCHTPAPWR